jgi:hypothetical protein
VTVETFSTPGATSWTAPAGCFSVKIGGQGPGGSGTNGVEDDPETPGQQGSGGQGGSGGGYGEKTLAVTPGQILYLDPGSADGTCWFNLGTNNSASASGAYRIGKGATRTPASGQSFDVGYNGGSGAPANGTNSLKGGGGGGGAGSAGAGGNAVTTVGGTGGSGGGGVGGNGGSGSAAGSGAAPGGGGGGGSSTNTTAGAGGDGKITLTYTVAASTSLTGPAFTATAGSITFRHSSVLPLTGPAFAVTPGTITFSGSHRLALSGPSFGITPGDMSFSTSGGGGDAESPVILPNQQVSDRALQASLATLVFRTSDTAPTRTAKLELLRTGVRGKTLALSITGLPDADPSVPLLRIELLDATEIGDVVASAGIARPAHQLFASRRTALPMARSPSLARSAPRSGLTIIRPVRCWRFTLRPSPMPRSTMFLFQSA